MRLRGSVPHRIKRQSGPASGTVFTRLSADSYRAIAIKNHISISISISPFHSLLSVNIHVGFGYAFHSDWAHVQGPDPGPPPDKPQIATPTPATSTYLRLRQKWTQEPRGAWQARECPVTTSCVNTSTIGAGGRRSRAIAWTSQCHNGWTGWEVWAMVCARTRPQAVCDSALELGHYLPVW